MQAGFQDKRRQNPRQTMPGRNQKSQERLPTHVAELRSLMSEQGVLVCTFLVDTETKALLHAVHLESRGLMLPHDGKSLHAQIVSASREFYEIALKDIPDIEPKDLNRLLKQDIEKLFRELLGRVPCVIILIHFL
jgi:mRNA degradation ribonuclease J1/J2